MEKISASIIEALQEANFCPHEYPPSDEEINSGLKKFLLARPGEETGLVIFAFKKEKIALFKKIPKGIAVTPEIYEAVQRCRKKLNLPKERR